MSHVDEGQIQAYLDRQLEFADETERRRLEDHLSKCIVCADLLQKAENIQERSTTLLNKGPHHDIAPPPFEDVIRRAEKTERSVKQRRRFSNATRLAWAASVVLAIGTGVYVRPFLTTDHADSIPERAGTQEQADGETAVDGLSEPVEEALEMGETAAPRANADRSNTRSLGASEQMVPSEGQRPSPTPTPPPLAQEPGGAASGNLLDKPFSNESGKAAASGAGSMDEVGVAQEREEFRLQENAPRSRASAPTSAPAPMTAGGARAARVRALDAQAYSDLADVPWRPTNLTDAAQHTGQSVLIVGGMPVKQVFVSEDGPNATMIVQEMNSGVRISLWETLNTRGWKPGEDTPAVFDGNHADTVINNMWVTIWAPISTESIHSLLERLAEPPDLD